MSDSADRSGSDPLLGRVIDGCVLDRKLGQGGMGIAYLATHQELDRQFVIKLLNPSLTGSSDTVQRFFREAQSVARLNHPNIIAIQNVGQDGDFYFIRMEYCDGQTLESMIRARKKLDWNYATMVMSQTAKALAHAHGKGIIHRDIKPENIMVSADGQTVKVMDYGLAKQVQAATKVSVTGQIVGTPFFMSPEQAGGKPTDARSDLYSVGVTYYYGLTGVKPFNGKNLQEIFLKHFFYTPESPKIYTPDLPEEVCDVIKKCLKKKKKERYQTADELAEDLDRILEGAGAPSEGPGNESILSLRGAPTDAENADVAAAMADMNLGDPTKVHGATGNYLSLRHSDDEVVDDSEGGATVVRGSAPPGADPGSPDIGDQTVVRGSGAPAAESDIGDQTVVRGAGAPTAAPDIGDQTVVRGSGAPSAAPDIGDQTVVRGPGAPSAAPDIGDQTVVRGPGAPSYGGDIGDQTVVRGPNAPSYGGDIGDQTVVRGPSAPSYGGDIGDQTVVRGPSAPSFGGDIGDQTVVRGPNAPSYGADQTGDFGQTAVRGGGGLPPMPRFGGETGEFGQTAVRGGGLPPMPGMGGETGDFGQTAVRGGGLPPMPGAGDQTGDFGQTAVRGGGLPPMPGAGGQTGDFGQTAVRGEGGFDQTRIGAEAPFDQTRIPEAGGLSQTRVQGGDFSETRVQGGSFSETRVQGGDAGQTRVGDETPNPDDTGAFQAPDYAGADYEAGSYQDGGYQDAGDDGGYQEAGYDDGGYQEPGYDDGGYQDPGYDEGYADAGYIDSDYGATEEGYATGAGTVTGEATPNLGDSATYGADHTRIGDADVTRAEYGDMTRLEDGQATQVGAGEATIAEGGDTLSESSAEVARSPGQVATVNLRNASQIFGSGDVVKEGDEVGDVVETPGGRGSRTPKVQRELPIPLPAIVALLVLAVIGGGGWYVLSSAAEAPVAELETAWANANRKDAQSINAVLTRCNEIYANPPALLDLARVKAVRDAARTALETVDKVPVKPPVKPGIPKNPDNPKGGGTGGETGGDTKPEDSKAERERWDKALADARKLRDNHEYDEAAKVLLALYSEIRKKDPNDARLAAIAVPVLVSSQPAGARILVGEPPKPVGRTPKVIDLAPYSEARIKVDRDAFEPVEQTVSADGYKELRVTLERKVRPIIKLGQSKVRLLDQDRMVEVSPSLGMAPVPGAEGRFYIVGRDGLLHDFSVGRAVAGWGQKKPVVGSFGDIVQPPTVVKQAGIFCAAAGYMQTRSASDQSIYFTVSLVDPDGGQRVWGHDSGSPCTTRALVILGDELPKSTGLKGLLIVGLKDGRLVFLDPDTGRPIMDKDEPKEFRAEGAIGGEPFVAGERVVFGARDNRIYSVKWSAAPVERTDYVDISGDLLVGPVAVPGKKTLVVATAGSVAALDFDRETGRLRLLWQRKLDESGVRGPIVVAEERIFVSTGTAIRALKLADGEPVKEFKVLGSAAVSFSGPVYGTEGMIYTTTTDGRLEARDSLSGERQWSYTCKQRDGTPARIEAPPVLLKDTVLVVTVDGMVVPVAR